MSLLTDIVKTEIREHSFEEWPNECCGLIIESEGKDRVIKCKNSAEDKTKFFEIDSKDYLRASRIGQVKAYYHSHPEQSPHLSGADKAVSISQKLPLIMYSITNNKFIEYNEQ